MDLKLWNLWLKIPTHLLNWITSCYGWTWNFETFWKSNSSFQLDHKSLWMETNSEVAFLGSSWINLIYCHLKLDHKLLWMENGNPTLTWFLGSSWTIHWMQLQCMEGEVPSNLLQIPSKNLSFPYYMESSGLWGLLMVPFFMSANRAVGERGIFFDGRNCEIPLNVLLDF